MSDYSLNCCSRCGRRLTIEEDAAFNPPTCMNCAREHVNTIKAEMIKNIAISVVLMVVGIIAIKSPAGILLAGIPYGWSFLNKITPAMFIWMSWIGLIALPIKMVKWISEILKVKQLEKNIH